MPMSGYPSESNRYVCHECTGDSILKGEILAAHTIRTCTYCKKRKRAVSIEVFAWYIQFAYDELVRIADEQMVTDEEEYDFRPVGSFPQDILSEMIEPVFDQISIAVADYLSEKNAFSVHHDGETNRYDTTSDIYEIQIPDDPRFVRSWGTFCELIKHHERHFSATATTQLDDILEPVTSGEWPKNKSAVRIIEPNSPEGVVFRGRLANTARARRDIFVRPIRSLSAPPPELCTAGRMNPAGISVFYASFDAATCVAELRAPVGGNVVVGKFELLKPIRVLDMTILDEASFALSYFDEDLSRSTAFNKFLLGFHDEIKKPVLPGDEHLSYLPTQFIAEYLWAHAEPKFDGVIFGSSQISNGGRNLVLFPQASSVAGYEDEVEREVSERPFRYGEDEDEIFSFRTKDGADEPKIAITGRNSLRLIADEMQVCTVQGIEYKTEARSVRMVREVRRLVTGSPGDDFAF
jgi:hypothetical protein